MLHKDNVQAVEQSISVWMQLRRRNPKERHFSNKLVERRQHPGCAHEPISDGIPFWWDCGLCLLAPAIKHHLEITHA